MKSVLLLSDVDLNDTLLPFLLPYYRHHTSFIISLYHCTSSQQAEYKIFSVLYFQFVSLPSALCINVVVSADWLSSCKHQCMQIESFICYQFEIQQPKIILNIHQNLFLCGRLLSYRWEYIQFSIFTVNSYDSYDLKTCFVHNSGAGQDELN